MIQMSGNVIILLLHQQFILWAAAKSLHCIYSLAIQRGGETSEYFNAMEIIHKVVWPRCGFFVCCHNG